MTCVWLKDRITGKQFVYLYFGSSSIAVIKPVTNKDKPAQILVI